MESVALTPPSSTPTVSSEPGDAIGENHVDHKALFEHFGLKESPRHHEALGRIWEYATQVADSKDKDSILFEVIRLNNRLGTPGIGMKPYAKMEAYVREWMKSREADKRMAELSAK